MLSKWGIAIALSALASIAALLATTTASSQPQTEVHLVYGPNSEIRARLLDVGQFGLQPADRVQARGPLYDETQMQTMGTAYQDCVVHKRIVSDTKGLWGCNYVLELADGDIVIQGMDPRGVGVYEMSVLGGTGAYAGASGDATFTDVGTDENGYTDMVIRLTVP
jgi:hypothetical protein